MPIEKNTWLFKISRMKASTYSLHPAGLRDLCFLAHYHCSDLQM